MAAKLKVLFVTHNYPRFAGDYAGIFLALLMRKITAYGIAPVIIAPHDKGAAEHEVIDGVKIYRFRYAATDEEELIAYRGNMHQLVLGSISGIFTFKKFLDKWRQASYRIIKEEQIELLAGHWLVPSGMVLKPLVKKTGLPAVISSHGTDIRLMRRYFNVVYRYLRSFCLKLKSWTVVSSFLKEGIVSMDRRLDAIIEVLPMPHDETIFFRDTSIAREDRLIVAVTRFTGQKRVDQLIKAMALLVEKEPDARLQIYGEGPQQRDIELLIEKFGLTEQVSIFPPVPQEQLREIYNRAAVVVLNSFQEGFGLVLSEAMLCGAAVVGTKSGGIVDIIEHDKTGLLVELDRPDVLAEAFVRLLADKELRDRLAENGHKYARTEYISDVLAEKYARILLQAANR